MDDRSAKVHELKIISKATRIECDETQKSVSCLKGVQFQKVSGRHACPFQGGGGGGDTKEGRG